ALHAPALRDALTYREPGMKPIRALCTALLLLAATSARALILDLAPVSQTAGVGAQLQVALQVSGLGDGAAPSLASFDVDLTFDASALSFVSAAFGDPVLGDQLDVLGLGSVTSASPGSGVVNLFELSLDTQADLDTLQAGDFTVATLTFKALTAGSSPLALGV